MFFKEISLVEGNSKSPWCIGQRAVHRMCGLETAGHACQWWQAIQGVAAWCSVSYKRCWALNIEISSRLHPEHDKLMQLGQLTRQSHGACIHLNVDNLLIILINQNQPPSHILRIWLLFILPTWNSSLYTIISTVMNVPYVITSISRRRFSFSLLTRYVIHFY